MVEAATPPWPRDTATTRLRLITASSLFDGDDAAVHIMRRLIQTHATEVIHLGHHRSVEDVVRAALQEDADAIAVSTQRGGHVEYFKYMVEMLHARSAGHIAVFVSSAEAFSAEEIAELKACGVDQFYHTPTGSQTALAQIEDMTVRAVRARDAARHHVSQPATAPHPPAFPERAAPEIPRRDAPPEPSYAWWPDPHAQPAPSPAPPPPPPPASRFAPLPSIQWVYGSFEQGARIAFNRHDPPQQGESADQAFIWEMDDSAPTALSAPAAPPPPLSPPAPPPVRDDSELVLGRMITRLEEEHNRKTAYHELRKPQPWIPGTAPVIGITGTGGAGKSSVVDELLLRFLVSFPGMRIAVISVDPTRRRSGGALLGDRIRMNSLRNPRVYMRSMATRRQNLATSAVLQDCIQCLRRQDFDLVIVETAGIGQSDSMIFDLVDLPIYVMTSDYGATSQLEKIDMLDYAELIVLNKYDQRGATDALHDIRQQWRRNRHAWEVDEEQIPIYPTIASHCNDPGINWMFVNLCRVLHERQQELYLEPLSHLGLDPGSEIAAGKYSANLVRCDFNLQWHISEKLPRISSLIPARRIGYLAEIAEHGRSRTARLHAQAEQLQKAQHCWQALGELGDSERPPALMPYQDDALADASVESGLMALRQRYHEALGAMSAETLQQLRQWQQRLAGMTGELLRMESVSKAMERQSIANIAAPHYKSWGDLLRFLGRENLPGHYPYTSGLHADHTRAPHPDCIIADEGTPERCNRHFHASRTHAAIHLSSVFDRLTLYAEDPDERPDIAGKIGHGGVSLPTLDAMKKLFCGFDLCAPDVSVSMTVNSPAPILLAMFINTAIDQQVEKYLKQDPGRWQQAQHLIATCFKRWPRPGYQAELPPGHNGLGLGLLGLSGDQLVDAKTYADIKAYTLSSIRGRLCMDVLEEDQARNTCIFSPEFALRMQGDMQQYCIEHGVQHFHISSISGSAFTEMGASPITQLAFVLANGFTLVEYYLARGLKIDAIAPHMNFFFSIGDELEYSVLGRVARRIWARAIYGRYGGNADSQQLKSRIPALDDRASASSGTSLQREFLLQGILHRELGLDVCENPWQASFMIDTLTDLVEEAVYQEFESINARGGVLGAMGGLYQRDKIQDEQIQRTRRKPAVNTAPSPSSREQPAAPECISASTVPAPLSPEERSRQIANVRVWQALRNDLSPHPLHHAIDASLDTAEATRSRASSQGLAYLHQIAHGTGNLFAALLEAVKTHSLGQISRTLYAAGGEHRRTM